MYKPDNDRTCCPQTPIRLDAHHFHASKSHRRMLNNLLFQVRTAHAKPAKWKGRWSCGRDWNVEHRWDEIETNPSHLEQHTSAWADRVAGPVTKKLQVQLQLASSSEEKYQLYRKYQSRVHGQSDDQISNLRGFQRFLVQSSLILTLPSTGKALNETEEAQWRQLRIYTSHLPEELPYGCYHQEYRLDGQLIAVGVLDILPSCVSSVYVFYDPDLPDWELGKVSALQEIALVRRLSALPSMHSLRFYYMGFYIASCQKMRYKAQYKPSQLLDCLTNTWHSLPSVESLNNGSTRPHPPDEDDRIPTEPRPPPGMLDPARFSRIMDTLRTRSVLPNDGIAISLLEKCTVLEAQRQDQGRLPLLVRTAASANTLSLLTDLTD